MAADSELVALIRSGDRTAFEAVYERYQPEILAHCRRLLRDRHEAEDALQHTFLAAYTNILASEQDLELRPWLYAIARNRCYSLMRARREVAVPELEQGVGEEPSVLVARREDLRLLVLDVNRLPDDQRAALLMAELGAHTHDEIAGALEVPRAKVKSLVFQARESLQASRTAREIDCAEIRHQLRTVRGAALRRGALRRHLRDCDGCREYRRGLRPAVPRVAGVLPVGPWLALRAILLRSSLAERAAPGAAGGGVSASAAIKLGALKPLAGALAAMLSAASAVVAVHSIAPHQHHVRSAGTAPRSLAVAPRSHVVVRRGGRMSIRSASMPARAPRVAHARSQVAARASQRAAKRHRSLGGAAVVSARHRDATQPPHRSRRAVPAPRAWAPHAAPTPSPVVSPPNGTTPPLAPPVLPVIGPLPVVPPVTPIVHQPQQPGGPPAEPPGKPTGDPGAAPGDPPPTGDGPGDGPPPVTPPKTPKPTPLPTPSGKPTGTPLGKPLAAPPGKPTATPPAKATPPGKTTTTPTGRAVGR